MIDDIHEPLEQYATDLKTAHANNVSDFFEDLVRQSGVDENANVQTVQELRKLEQQVEGASSANRWWRVLRGLVVALALSALVYVLVAYSWPWMILPTAISAPVIYLLSRVIRDSHARRNALEQARDAKRAEAWGQMAPLNRLFDWDIAAKLVQKTLPCIAFDPYFANGRMEELRENFGLSVELADDRSVVFSHSGVLNGNPFILARMLTHWMGRKTYKGSLEIKWTTPVRGSDGEWRTETHYETLYASVEKPFPEYGNQTFVVYGNEAAPDLQFSRSPSELSKLGDGFFDRRRTNRAIKKLEKKSRDIGGGSTFAVMSNREFDAVFGATDRNDEVQFRLLFTPLAQQEMLKLLKDRHVGYGDDFSFTKNDMINFVESVHMRQADIGGEPEKFCFYELAQTRAVFNRYHNDFFHSFYFGIAPLLAIPLYQQHRSHADIYKDTYASRSCFWEHEAIANFHGEEKFKHPECVTRSILKTASRVEGDGSQRVRVTATGYSCVERVDYVAVRGGDGRSHEVPVHWNDYSQVQQASEMLLMERAPADDDGRNPAADDEEATLRAVFERRGIEYRDAVVRRSIVSAVLPS